MGAERDQGADAGAHGGRGHGPAARHGPAAAAHARVAHAARAVVRAALPPPAAAPARARARPRPGARPRPHARARRARPPRPRQEGGGTYLFMFTRVPPSLRFGIALIDYIAQVFRCFGLLKRLSIELTSLKIL